MDIDISVIIPVYNTEAYLRECVNSVLIQKGINYEIIIIDDGSTDNSPSICDELASKNYCIKCIHKNNEGLGYARNDGLDVAIGKYIFFLDSDDLLPPNTLLNVYNLAETYQVNMVSFNFLYTNNRKNTVHSKVEIENKVYTSKEFLREYFEEEYFSSAIWSKLYKKDLWNDFRFTNIKLHEDAEIMPIKIHQAEKILHTNQIFYIQYCRPGSLIQSKFNENNFLSLTVGKENLDFIKQEYPDLSDSALYALIKRQLAILDRILVENIRNKYCYEYKHILKELKNNLRCLCNTDFNRIKYKKSIKEYNKYLIPFFYKQKIFVINIMREIYLILTKRNNEKN